jgi:hypothetical protein
MDGHRLSVRSLMGKTEKTGAAAKVYTFSPRLFTRYRSAPVNKLVADGEKQEANYTNYTVDSVASFQSRRSEGPLQQGNPCSLHEWQWQEVRAAWSADKRHRSAR